MAFENPISSLQKLIANRKAVITEKKVTESFSSKITLKSATAREILSIKLAKYQDLSTNPAIEKTLALEAAYRVLLAQELINTGTVDVVQIYQEERHKPEFDLTIFKSACDVIKDYAENEGRGLVQGK